MIAACVKMLPVQNKSWVPHISLLRYGIESQRATEGRF